MPESETGAELDRLLKHLHGHPEDAAGHFRAGWLLGQGDRFPEALEHLRPAVSGDPENPLAWYYLAIAAARSGDRQAAREGTEQFARLAPEDA
ncbi:MAG TPA: tetratricopeptide repeat protein, partial [Armatimonadota bacterium]|nr:tetratricopeptide repeat protein [Armatimonadota bacterium]